MRLFSNGWRLLAIGLVALVGACGDDNDGEVRLLRLEVAPATQTIAAGTTVQLRATGIYSDGNSFDVTSQAAWQSSDTDAATVSDAAGSKGLVTGNSRSNGPVTITATLDEIAATSAITVSAATIKLIQVSPDDGPLPRGLQRQLTATAVFTDNSSQDITASANWVSTDTSVAVVGNTSGDKGLYRAVGPNASQATITASSGGVTGSLPVRVSAAKIESIEVSPASLSIAYGGFEKKFTATGVFSDGTTGDITDQVVWSVLNTDLATVSNAAGEKGKLTTTTEDSGGGTAVVAKAGDKESRAQVNVRKAKLTSIEIDATNKRFAPATDLTVGLGRTLQFVATGSFSGTQTPDLDISNFVIWSTSDVAVATISNAEASRGKSVTQGPGVAEITASIKRGVGASVPTVTEKIDLTVTSAEVVSMVVEPSTLTLPRSFKAPLRVVGTFSDSSQEDISSEVTWTSQDSNIAVVGNTGTTRGVVTGGNPGNTLITASLPGTGIEADANAVITGATLAGISVAPAAATIPQGVSQLFTATASFSDGSTLDVTNYGQTVWTSSDTNTARIVANGEAFGFAQGGGVKIKASRPGSVLEGVADLTVNGVALVELRIVPKSFAGCTGAFSTPRAVEKVPVGSARRFIACARFYDGFIGDVTSQATWATQGPGVIAVGNTGAVKGRVTTTGREKEQGVIEVSYTDDYNIRKTDTYTVGLIDGSVTAITITSSRDLTAQQAPGTGIQFEAVASYSDGSTNVNITEGSTWTTSDDEVVAISNTDGTRGAAVVQQKGSGGLLGGEPPSSATIRASRGGVNSPTVTVNRTP